MDELLSQLEEPEDYFSGIGHGQLPTPSDVLVFLRETKEALQQEALQNRSHHRHVLALNFETEGAVHVDHLEHGFAADQALLILPYQFHHFSQLEGVRLKWLFCTFELESQKFLEPLRHTVVDLSKETRGAARRLLEEWHRKHPEGVQSALLRLLLGLKRDRENSGSDPLPRPESSLLRDINQMMGERCGKLVVVSDLAGSLGCSVSHLRALFRETAGIPLGRYIQNYRLNRAMSLLRTSELSIADVAAEAGFGSPQAFSRVFKNEAGITPRAYRDGGQVSRGSVP